MASSDTHTCSSRTSTHTQFTASIMDLNRKSLQFYMLFCPLCITAFVKIQMLAANLDLTNLPSSQPPVLSITAEALIPFPLTDLHKHTTSRFRVDFLPAIPTSKRDWARSKTQNAHLGKVTEHTSWKTRVTKFRTHRTFVIHLCILKDI